MMQNLWTRDCGKTYANSYCHCYMYVLMLFLHQAEELRKSLWEKNVPAKVYVGMRYWHPFTEEAIEQVC